MHHRQVIREAIATALTGLVTTGARVYQSRLHPLEPSKLPCLLVNTDSEDTETITMHPMPLLDRQLTITVRCIAKVSQNLDDVLDTMMAEVEQAIGGNTLNDAVKTLELKTINIEMESETDKPVGIATMSFLTSYMTAANNAAIAI